MDVTTKPLLRFTSQLVHNSMYFVVFITHLRESRKLKKQVFCQCSSPTTLTLTSVCLYDNKLNTRQLNSMRAVRRGHVYAISHYLQIHVFQIDLFLSEHANVILQQQYIS